MSYPQIFLDGPRALLYTFECHNSLGTEKYRGGHVSHGIFRSKEFHAVPNRRITARTIP